MKKSGVIVAPLFFVVGYFRNFAKSVTRGTSCRNPQRFLTQSGNPGRSVKTEKKRKPTTNAIQIIHRRYYEGRPQRIAELEEAGANDTVARKIYQLRKRAGLTQEKLAKLVGTTTSVISRLEDADYQGHSLAMLRRIASALNKRVELRFVSASRKPKVA
jgi:DNA-binding XRE family transcriptional regulator